MRDGPPSSKYAKLFKTRWIWRIRLVGGRRRRLCDDRVNMTLEI